MNVQPQRLNFGDLGATTVPQNPAFRATAGTARGLGSDRVRSLLYGNGLHVGIESPVQNGIAGAPANGTGGLQGILQQLMGLLQQLLGALGGLFGGGAIFGSGDAFFNNATGSSTGDPHLAFNGTNANGQAETQHFDNMNPQSDLLDSDSFAGGYQISTATTAPNQNGVTYNQSATIATQNGAVSVSLDDAGNATVSQYGTSFALQDGQTVDLGGGETVTRAQNGSLTVTDDNGMGGEIATTLSENGSGVDVNATAQNVDLGGTLVGGAPQTPQATPAAPPFMGDRHSMARPSLRIPGYR